MQTNGHQMDFSLPVITGITGGFVGALIGRLIEAKDLTPLSVIFGAIAIAIFVWYWRRAYRRSK